MFEPKPILLQILNFLLLGRIVGWFAVHFFNLLVASNLFVAIRFGILLLAGRVIRKVCFNDIPLVPKLAVLHEDHLKGLGDVFSGARVHVSHWVVVVAVVQLLSGLAKDIFAFRRYQVVIVA